jgi:glycosyltransferase involved in cell wall biosynthesis
LSGADQRDLDGGRVLGVCPEQRSAYGEGRAHESTNGSQQLGDRLPEQGARTQLTASRPMRHPVARLVEAVRIFAYSLPEPLHARLRGIVMWSERLRSAPPIGDWSAPLIGKASGESSSNVMIQATPTSGDDDVSEPRRSRGTAVLSTVHTPTLRCLVATPRLDVGGLEEMVAFLARRLPAHGLETVVLHASSGTSAWARPNGRMGRILHSAGVEVRHADESAARAWIKEWRPDVISSQGAPQWVFGIARDMGVPYVDYLLGSYNMVGSDWDWHAEAAHDGTLSAVVAVSERVRGQYLAGIPGFPSDRIVTIPNAVDDARRVRGDRAAARDWLGLTDEYLVVSLARQEPVKNCYGLVSAFADLARQRAEVHLVVAGRLDDPRYCRKVLQLRENLPCRDRVHLRDYVPASGQLLAAADGFALDSFFEGDPIVSMEALCAGVPVVLSEVGSAREQVGNDSSRGYVVAHPAGDPLNADWTSVGAVLFGQQANRDELVAALDALVANRHEYLRNRDRLAAESAERFSADVCIARHAAVLQAVAVGAGLPTLKDAGATFAAHEPSSI